MTENRLPGDDTVFGHEVWRRPVELLTSKLVFKRRLPKLFGHRRIYVTPSCGLKVLHPLKSPFTNDLLLAVAFIFVHPGDTVWDVGANMGVFSLAAAARCQEGAVLSFEPDPDIIGLLRSSLRLPENAALNVRAFELSISDEDGVGILNINSRSRAMNNLSGKSLWSGVRSSEYLLPTPMLKLDTVLRSARVPEPDFVKVDVEGSELAVLRGAVEIIKRVRPVWLIEVASENAPEAKQIFDANDYAVFDGNSLASGLKEGGVYDWLLIPREKVEGMRDRIEVLRREYFGQGVKAQI